MLRKRRAEDGTSAGANSGRSRNRKPDENCELLRKFGGKRQETGGGSKCHSFYVTPAGSVPEILWSLVQQAARRTGRTQVLVPLIRAIRAAGHRSDRPVPISEASKWPQSVHGIQ